jgi:hypothetical protein
LSFPPGKEVDEVCKTVAVAGAIKKNESTIFGPNFVCNQIIIKALFPFTNVFRPI